MNTTAIYHRPESEFAYLFEKTKCILAAHSSSRCASRAIIMRGSVYLIQRSLVPTKDRNG